MNAFMRRLAAWLSAAAVLAVVQGRLGAADDFSGADKLRSIYSAEFSFTQDGLPVVPVAIAEGLLQVTVSAEGGLRLLPEGEGGPEIRADDAWTIAGSSMSAAKFRYWAVVWRGRGGDGKSAAAEADARKARGEKARIFEHGTLFAVAGEVLDRREALVAVGPYATFELADKAPVQGSLSARGRGVHSELVERPRGELEAVGQRTGARVRNEGVLWFSPVADGPIHVRWTGATPGEGSYHGRVYVTIDRRGTLAVVNALPEDKLLAGLVPAEIFPAAPAEALKAQAVAARGELLTKIGSRHFGDPYRLCAQTHCQVYAGAGRETPRTTAAVVATRGEVVFNRAGKDLVDTVYSANCGGHTEHSENVWPDMAPSESLRGHFDGPATAAGEFARGVTSDNVAKFLEAAPSAWCGRTKQGADRYRWMVTRTAQELRHLLTPFQVGDVRSISVVARGVSGRATEVRIVGSGRTETLRGELRIRQAFGGLRSSLFTVEMTGGDAHFRGAGFGHGVGLCQTGAIGMALAGTNYRTILQHYYPGSVLRKLW